MGTRGAIARKTKDGFEGRYHHWDSYSDGLGEALFKLCRGHFGGDFTTMVRTLIDDHPGGWSTIIGADWALVPGFNERAGPDRPQCYCHGDRSEEGWLVTQDNAGDSGCEYVYVIDEKGTMQVLSSYNSDGGKMIGFFGQGNPDAKWVEIGKVDLTSDEEPDWVNMGRSGEED